MTFLIALALGVVAAPALGDGRQVLADYEDNGRIDGCYTLADFEDALTSIRPDQQQYGAAVDVIRQAELTNIRRPGEACGGTSANGTPDPDPVGSPGTAESEGDALPPVVILVLVVGGLGIIGFVGYMVVSRRRRGDRDA